MVACSRSYYWQMIEMALGLGQSYSRIDAMNRLKVNLCKANVFSFSKPVSSSCASWMSTIPKILFHMNELSELWPNDHNQILSTIAFSCVTLYGFLPSKISEVTWFMGAIYSVIWRNPRILTAVTPCDHFHAVGCIYRQYIWCRFQEKYTLLETSSSLVLQLPFKEQSLKCAKFPNIHVDWWGINHGRIHCIF